MVLGSLYTLQCSCSLFSSLCAYFLHNVCTSFPNQAFASMSLSISLIVWDCVEMFPILQGIPVLPEAMASLSFKLEATHMPDTLALPSEI